MSGHIKLPSKLRNKLERMKRERSARIAYENARRDHRVRRALMTRTMEQMSEEHKARAKADLRQALLREETLTTAFTEDTDFVLSLHPVANQGA